MRWDRLKLVLAIARAGTLSGAARRLGISHATAYRQIVELERELDTALFERRDAGYVATEAGRRFAEAAAVTENEIRSACLEIVGADRPPSGPLRVTTTDTLYTGLLAPIMQAFCQACPNVTLIVDVSNSVHDLARRTADVAIRPDNAPAEHLVGRQLGVIPQAIYRAVDLPEDNAAWVGPSEQMGYPALAHWFVAEGRVQAVACWLNSGLAMQAAAAAGVGRAVLPCYLGDSDPRLQREGDPVVELATALWLLIHPAVRGTPSVRAFGTFMAERIADALAHPPSP